MSAGEIERTQREKKDRGGKRDEAQQAEGKLSAPAEENVLWAAALREDPAHTEMTCSLLNGLYHVLDQGRVRGGRSWTELLSCNSLTYRVCCVDPTPYGVCNELVIGCNRGKVQIVSLYLLLSLRSGLRSTFDEHLSSPLYRSPPAPTFPSSRSLTHPLSLCLSHPLFFHSIIYSSLCPGKAHPHIGGRGRGLAQSAQGENISTLRANLAKDRGMAL